MVLQNAGQITDPEQAAQIITHIRQNPAWFTKNVLHYDPWGMQEDILNALAKPRARVAVKACHSSGKTSLAAMAVFWRVITGGIVITTAPTFVQVSKLLWGEIHRTYALYKDILGGDIFQTEWRINPNCFAIGISTNEGTRMQGWHGDIMVILDEAPGVRPDIWEAIEGIRAGGDVTLLALGNPTTIGNPFHSAFQTGGDSGWDLFSISAFNTPNFERFPTIEHVLEASREDLLDVPRPYLTTPTWVREKYLEWGPNSPMYQSRVLAIFPEHSEHTLIPMHWILASQHRDVPMDEKTDFYAGIDVAGAGEDETVVVVRQGDNVLSIKAWTDPDPRQEVIEHLSVWREKAEAVDARFRVFVDSIAIGHYFALDIKNAGFDTTPINVGLPAITEQRPGLFVKKVEKNNPGELRFINLKAQMYWRLREKFQTNSIGGPGMSDSLLQEQVSNIRYEEQANGAIRIEGKEEAKKRGVKSPDRAEALMLSYGVPSSRAAGPPPVLMVDSTGGNWYTGLGEKKSNIIIPGVR